MVATREERLTRLVAVCVHNDKTPNNTTGFADFIINVCTSSLGMCRRTAKEYLKTIISSFRRDKWRSQVINNCYLSETERRHWIEHNN